MIKEFKNQINLFAQEKISKDEIFSSFKDLSDVDKLSVIIMLACFVSQTHATKEEVLKGVEDSGLKPTYTSAVILAKFPLLQSLSKVIALPSNERIKTFSFLLYIFKIADTRRKNTDCKDGCTHDWHNL